MSERSSVRMVTQQELAADLQAIADLHPAEYAALYEEVLRPTACHQHCYLDRVYGWNSPDLRADLEEAMELLWLSGVGGEGR